MVVARGQENKRTSGRGGFEWKRSSAAALNLDFFGLRLCPWRKKKKPARLIEGSSNNFSQADTDTA